MAKGKKTGGRDFLPGNNANPRGRPRLGRDLRESRRACGDKLLGAVIKYLGGDRTRLKGIAEDITAPMAEVMAARLVYNASSRGDMGSLRLIFEQLVGKKLPTIEAEEAGTCPPLTIHITGCRECERVKELERRVLALGGELQGVPEGLLQEPR